LNTLQSLWGHSSSCRRPLQPGPCLRRPCSSQSCSRKPVPSWKTSLQDKPGWTLDVPASPCSYSHPGVCVWWGEPSPSALAESLSHLSHSYKCENCDWSLCKAGDWWNSRLCCDWCITITTFACHTQTI
jgi:hypothetical protein